MIAANTLGDMTVLANIPLAAWKALAVISAHAHPAYDECSGLAPGASHDKCLFMSLAVRDFMVKIGYPDATVRGCCLCIRADNSEHQEIWSVGIGAPGEADIEGKFNGHIVCVIPSLKLLIDTTVYQAIRPHWCGAVTGMAAVQYHEPWQSQKFMGMPSIAGIESAREDRSIIQLWFDRPELNWRNSEDFRVKNDRRRHVTRALMQAHDG